MSSLLSVPVVASLGELFVVSKFQVCITWQIVFYSECLNVSIGLHGNLARDIEAQSGGQMQTAVVFSSI